MSDYQKEFRILVKKYNRSTFSSASTLFINTFNKLIQCNKNKKIMQKQIAKNKNILLSKKQYFINKIKNENVDNYMIGGFFAYIITNKSIYIAEQLMKKHIYVVPMEIGIRMSIASLRKKEIGKLIKMLSKYD